MSRIRLADGLTIPLDATPQPIALIGRRGSGKTYAAGKLTEEFLDAGLQVVVLDPVGTWWGLRLQADGKTPAYSIPVLGGSHGDIPLEASAGKLIAQLVAERGLSVVLDVSEFTGADQRRFVAGFAQELLQAKKRHKSALMLVMEEAQEFAPQMARGDVATMLGAVEKVVKLGRNFGIVPVLVSQRPQSVNKDVLNQTELLLTFQLTGPQERKTVDGWVQEKGADRSIVGELPGLPVGTALVWSPQWLGVFGRFTILPKRTYDASATPGAAPVAAASLRDIDLEAVRTAMAATIEKAKADDPRELRKELATARGQIRELTELAHRANAAAALGNQLASLPPKEVEVIREVPVFSAADEERIAGLEASLQDIAGKLGDMAADVALLRSQVREARSGKGGVDRDTQGSPKGVRPSATRGYGGNAVGPRSPEQDNRRTLPPAAASATLAPFQPLSKAERAILSALAQYPDGRTKTQVALLTGYSSKGGGFNNAVSSLRTRGYLEGSRSSLRITDAGLNSGIEWEPLPRGQELIDYWLRQLGKAEREVLVVLTREGRVALSKEEVADYAGYVASGGGFNNALSRLRTLELIEGRGELVASEVLFE